MTPQQQKVPAPAIASVWLLAATSGLNLAIGEWFMAVGFASLGIVVLGIIYMTESAT